MIQGHAPSRAKDKPRARNDMAKNTLIAQNYEPMLQTLFNSLNHAVAAFSAQSGALTYANTAFHLAFSFKTNTSKLLNEFKRDFVHLMMDGDSSPTDASKLAPHFAGKVQDMLHRPSGRWYCVHVVNASAESGDMVILHLADITQRLEAEQRKHTQRQQMLFTSKVMSVGEMAATLAHELNQPIGSITNYLNGTLRYLDAHPEIDANLLEPLRSAKKQAERAASIITRIRQFVRAREPKLNELSIDEVTASVLTLVEPESTKYGVQIYTEIAQDLPTVKADRVMIEQVLHNLVKNAIEAMIEPSVAQKMITIAAKKTPSDLVEVSVEDTGKGLSQETGGQIFSPFFTTKTDGLGIGLNICRSMIEYHSGSLFFKNNENRVGSTFAFTLPKFAVV